MSAYQKVNFAPINDAAFGMNSRPKKRNLSEADVAAQRAEAFAEGEIAGVNANERQTAESLRSIAHMMQMILGQLSSESEQLRKDAIDLALVSAKAIAASAINANNETQITDYLKEALSNLSEAPHLIVKVPTQSVAMLKPKLLETAEEAGFSGRLDIRGDDEARLGDCSIEWQNGAIRHQRDETINKIEQLAIDWLSQANSAAPIIDVSEP